MWKRVVIISFFVLCKTESRSASLRALLGTTHTTVEWRTHTQPILFAAESLLGQYYDAEETKNALLIIFRTISKIFH